MGTPINLEFIMNPEILERSHLELLPHDVLVDLLLLAQKESLLNDAIAETCLELLRRKGIHVVLDVMEVVARMILERHGVKL